MNKIRVYALNYISEEDGKKSYGLKCIAEK